MTVIYFFKYCLDLISRLRQINSETKSKHSVFSRSSNNDDSLSSPAFSENNSDTNNKHLNFRHLFHSNTVLSKAHSSLITTTVQNNENKNLMNHITSSSAIKITNNKLLINSDSSSNNNDNNISINLTKTNSSLESLITAYSNNATKTPQLHPASNSPYTELHQQEIEEFYDYTKECLVNIDLINVISDNDITLNTLRNEIEDEIYKNPIQKNETLVHSEVKDYSKGEIQLEITLPTEQKAKIGVNLRPHLFESLEHLSKQYNLIVFTASHKYYADAVLDYIDPSKKLIKHRLYRNHCIKSIMNDNQTIYVKDLRIFSKVFDLKDIIIIDNSVLSFAYQLENGVPIIPFFDNKKDEELHILTNYLDFIHNCEDFRIINRKRFKLKELKTSL